MQLPHSCHKCSSMTATGNERRTITVILKKHSIRTQHNLSLESVTFPVNQKCPHEEQQKSMTKVSKSTENIDEDWKSACSEVISPPTVLWKIAETMTVAKKDR